MKDQSTSVHGKKDSVFHRGIEIKKMNPGKRIKGMKSMGGCPKDEDIPEGKFGVLFEELDGFDPPNEALKQIADLMVDNSDESDADSDIPLALAFLGQFIDHDLTLEPVSLFDDRVDPMALMNFRTAALDLDSVYGSNPDVFRHLYDTFGMNQVPGGFDEIGSQHRLPVRLLMQDENVSVDLQRNRQGTAIIGDPRNDENLFISQLHRMIVGFHNQVVKHLENEHKDNPLGNKQLYEEARKLVTLHYHWIILHEFLPAIIGQERVDDILQRGRKHYKYEKYGKRPFIPIEFAGAAYRFGHTLIRSRYNLNDQTQGLDLFKVPFFGLGPMDQPFEIGVPQVYNLDWRYFLNFGDNNDTLQFCRKIDSKVTMPLFDLPFIDARQDPPTSLPERNMRRGRTLMLPSGQAVAKAMKFTPLTNAQLEIEHIDGLNGESPLWYYILKEAEVQTNSKHLGEVGGTIVGEVLIGIIEATQKILYFEGNDQARKNWEPTLGQTSGEFTLKDLVTYKV